MSNHLSIQVQDDTCKSKSQVKRDMIALKKLGERLLELSTEQFNALSMEVKLKEAVIEAKRLKRGKAKKRQIQYIGKLMRAVDVEPIKIAMEKFDSSSKLHAQKFHKLEKIRTGLMEDDSLTIDELFAEQPGIDRQYLHQLVRKAQKEQDSAKSDRTHYRKLFRFIRSLQDSS